jgi:hypothetical protein
MEPPYLEVSPTVGRNRDLESLATGVELTLASVLQGIPLATLVPRIVDLLLSGDPSRLLYAPASLLIVFMVWVMFILYALSFVTWPFDPIHSLMYFLIVCAEAVVLGLIDRPGIWFLALIGLGVILGLNISYNQRKIKAQIILYAGIAGRALHANIMQEQAKSLQFIVAYVLVGAFGAALVPGLQRIGIEQGFVWAAASLAALAVPLIHVVWLIRLVPIRSQLIEAARAEGE